MSGINLFYPLTGRDSAKSGLGHLESHHLSASAEYISVNVGGSYVEGSSPPMKHASVGGVIVLGGRESRLQGEGRQGIDDVLVN
jgi:hypothetical protein